MFQVDPMNPPPLRDIRWSMIVTGIALAIVGVIFLSLGALVAGALSAAGAGCLGSSCTGPDVGGWFTWFDLPFLALGVVLFLVGLWWGLKVPATAR